MSDKYLSVIIATLRLPKIAENVHGHHEKMGNKSKQFKQFLTVVAITVNKYFTSVLFCQRRADSVQLVGFYDKHLQYLYRLQLVRLYRISGIRNSRPKGPWHMWDAFLRYRLSSTETWIRSRTLHD